ncbi:energy transducer TonB [Pseudidiomarina aestuarii]|uniref:Energy transducer TonB n=1 Tax=Pseudidiomarina aestuarii TaxID=624146 RepID=A0A2T4D7A4_9GAMM|nr:energy transducer TonB [Pseudidiomarina aestuarii]PTB89458.1 energy transducer TonB [Pseudidiomarina aestuarii]PTB89697.1 energy transducer TonB [Pseudidiomarina aestuarii]
MKGIALSSALLVIGFGLMTSSSAQVTGSAHVKLSQLEPAAEEALWSREKDYPVAYPMELAMDGVTGCAVLEVKVDSDGDTDAIELVSGVPSREMKFSAPKLVRSWEWVNRTERPNAAETKLIRLDFCMERGDESVAIAACEAQAKLECR